MQKKQRDILDRLLAMADPQFREFNAKLIPNIDHHCMIGVKTPALRTLAKDLCESGEDRAYLAALPHRCFEENQLHAFIIGRCRDFDAALALVERFLPYIDNWATCDQLTVPAFAAHPERLLPKIEEWLGAKHIYTVRFAIGCLLRWFLDGRFDERYLRWVAEVESEEYYVGMMQAWYFATAAAKQYDALYRLLEAQALPRFVQNQTIRKAKESCRVSPEHKLALSRLIRK